MPSKTRRFVLPIVSAMSTAFLVHGCGRNDPRQICVDATNTRVQDAGCARPGSPYHWYYYPTGGGGAAGIGSRAYGGSYMRAAGANYSAAPAEGVSRGGFGAIGRAFGGGGEGGGGE